MVGHKGVVRSDFEERLKGARQLRELASRKVLCILNRVQFVVSISVSYTSE